MPFLIALLFVVRWGLLCEFLAFANLVIARDPRAGQGSRAPRSVRLTDGLVLTSTVPSAYDCRWDVTICGTLPACSGLRKYRADTSTVAHPPHRAAALFIVGYPGWCSARRSCQTSESRGSGQFDRRARHLKDAHGSGLHLASYDGRDQPPDLKGRGGRELLGRAGACHARGAPMLARGWRALRFRRPWTFLG